MSGTVNWLFVDLNSYFASVEQEARTFAARSLQISEEASDDGHNVAEIATRLGLIVMGR